MRPFPISTLFGRISLSASSFLTLEFLNGKSSGTRKKEEKSDPLPTFSLHQALSRVGRSFSPKGEKMNSWKGEVKKTYYFCIKHR